jgi:hypothetical protein
VPFEVPASVAEVEVYHMNTGDPDNILDFGLNDSVGFRGWGGGNRENAVVGLNATSRSYLAGPMPAGTWSVVVGKAQLSLPPCAFDIQVTLRDAPTLPPQPERQPYAPHSPLSDAARYYSGDFHIHGRESGDAYTSATLDEIASFAHGRGLDFVHISDHNTVSAASFMVDAQRRHPDTLILPGMEWTSYAGHAGAIGTSEYVDHKVGVGGVTVSGAAAAIHAQGGLFSINHEDSFQPGGVEGNKCVGCAWQYRGLNMSLVDTMEVGVQGMGGLGALLTPPAIDLWFHLQQEGFTHIAPIGGSDDHHGGANDSLPNTGSPIGNPTTLVLAANLSHAGIIEGLRLGRTVVKLYGPDDPMVHLSCACAAKPEISSASAVPKKHLREENRAAVFVEVGGWCRGAGGGTLTALVTTHGRSPTTLTVLRNNAVTAQVQVPAGAVDWKWTMAVLPPADGGPGSPPDMWRAELRDNAASRKPRTLTNHIFLGQ